MSRTWGPRGSTAKSTSLLEADVIASEIADDLRNALAQIEEVLARNLALPGGFPGGLHPLSVGRAPSRWGGLAGQRATSVLELPAPARSPGTQEMAEGEGFEPPEPREGFIGFQDRCLRPLGHPSALGMLEA